MVSPLEEEIAMTEFKAIRRMKTLRQVFLATALLLSAANVALAVETLSHL